MDELAGTSEKKRLRIGFDGAALANRRGFGRFARGILQGLIATNPGHELHVVIDSPSAEMIDWPDEVNRHLVPLPRSQAMAASARGNRSARELMTMSRAVARMRFDLYYFASSFTFFPLRPGQKSIVTFHDTLAVDRPDLVFPTRQGRWFWWLKEQAARWNASRITTVSETSRRDLARFFRMNVDLIGLLTEGVDDIFRAPDHTLPNVAQTLAVAGLTAHEPFWMYVGGLSPHKNLPRLIEACAGMPEEAGKLLLVGDFGDNFHTHVPQIRAKIEELGLNQRVILTGFVPDDRLAVMYRKSRGVILPSLWEGFGLPAAEAMASGTAVLHSTAGSLPEVVGDGGLHFDPLNVAEIRRQWLKLNNDNDLRRTLADLGRKRAEAYRWELAGQLLWDEIEKTIGGGQGKERWAG